MDAISILAALDEHYLPQLHVLLTSLRLNNPGEHMDLYLLQSAVSPEGLAGVERLCAAFGYGFFPVRVDDALFQGAPVSRQYPKEMYYRLLASRLLPDTLDRVLYLDPDILVLNPLRPLWETDLEGNLFAAAAHTGKTELANSVNRMRLNSGSDYYNSGVLLMDLAAARREKGAAAPRPGPAQRPVRPAHPAPGRRPLELRRPQLQQLPAAQRRGPRPALGDGAHRHPSLLRKGQAVETGLCLPLRRPLPPLRPTDPAGLPSMPGIRKRTVLRFS